MADNPFEIPQTLRDVSEQNLKQARAAYEQLMDFVTKAMGAGTGALPSNPMAAGFKDVQDRAAAMAKQNAESVFALVEKIAKAQNFQEIVTLQTQFAQDRMQAFVTQTQQLFSVIEEAIQKSERGAMDAGTGAMPSNPMPSNSRPLASRMYKTVSLQSRSRIPSQFRAGRKDRQGTEFPGDCDASDAVCSRPDAGLRHADAGSFKLIGEAIQKSERGAMDAGTGALPSNPMVTGFKITGFKDVQDRVAAMAKQNTKSVFALVEKIAKAQNFQEIVTLQTQFAQDRMSGLRHADPGVSKADRRSSPEAPTRLICKSQTD